MAQYENEYLIGNFRRWVNMNTKKSFNLNGTKDEIRREFLDKYLGAELSSLDDLVFAIANSYVKTNIDKIKPFISGEEMGMGISQKPVFLSKFLSEYILEEPVECKTNGEFYQAISHFLTSTLEDACGDVLWVDKLIPTGKEHFRKRLVEDLKEKGYVPFKKDGKIWMRPTSQENGVADFKYQDFLIEQYGKIVKEYVQKHDMHTLKKSDEKEFYDFWSVIECVVMGYETRIADKAKASPEFLTAKAIADKFFSAENLEKHRKAHTRHGKRGNYCEALYDAVHNFKDGTQTEEDIALLKEFYGRIEKLNKALSVVDEKGKEYPANFFVCMPDIHPASVLDLLSSFERNKVFEGEKQLMIADTKRKIRKSFATNTIRNNGDNCELRHVLHVHKIRVQRGDFVIDNTTEEGYANFVGRVAKIIADNNLPSSDICASIIARDLMAGRENPINMPKENKLEMVAGK